ncbi:protein kinase [Streptomyces aidingensis]|uniref:Protein tyrosine kinase n=1 Tax=Streptomyces aidingensis TaxID=910347 RepID=A0A1I1EAF7_9ACTN|nr:protein kinase [Streptomyces aidingensis]SFB84085.1 Protein tyrosine kinase [Streptomyces aidingensis]
MRGGVVDKYAGRLLADRYRLPKPPTDGFELAECAAYDTASGQEVLVRQVPLPEVVDAETLAGGFRGASERATRTPDDPVVRRAVEAAAAAARLPDHPRLDQVYDVFVQGDGLWIVSELVPARPLAALLAEQRLNPYRAAEVAADLLSALRVVHASGWVHRNLTARTVLVCEDGRAMLTGLAIGAAEEVLCGYDPFPLSTTDDDAPGGPGVPTEGAIAPPPARQGLPPGASRPAAPQPSPDRQPHPQPQPQPRPNLVKGPEPLPGFGPQGPPGPRPESSVGRPAEESEPLPAGPEPGVVYGPQELTVHRPPQPGEPRPEPDVVYGPREPGQTPARRPGGGAADLVARMRQQSGMPARHPVEDRPAQAATGFPESWDFEGGRAPEPGPDPRPGARPPGAADAAGPQSPQQSTQQWARQQAVNAGQEYGRQPQAHRPSPAAVERAGRSGAIAAYRAGARAGADAAERGRPPSTESGEQPAAEPQGEGPAGLPGRHRTSHPVRTGWETPAPGTPHAGSAARHELPRGGGAWVPGAAESAPREGLAADDGVSPPELSAPDARSGGADAGRELPPGGADGVPRGGWAPGPRRAPRPEGAADGSQGHGLPAPGREAESWASAVPSGVPSARPQSPAALGPGPGPGSGPGPAPWQASERPAGTGHIPDPGRRYRGPDGARAAERARQARITTVGAVTERWAPEQAGPVYDHWRLAPPVGPAADLWALGALLFRAVQGHPPYPEENAAELTQAVCAEQPAFAEDSGALRPVIESLLRQDPTERPSTEELAGWLRSIIRSAPAPTVGLRTATPPMLNPGEPADPHRLPVIRRRGELVSRRKRRTASSPRRLGWVLLSLILLGVAGAMAYALFLMETAETGGSGSANPGQEQTGQSAGTSGDQPSGESAGPAGGSGEEAEEGEDATPGPTGQQDPTPSGPVEGPGPPPEGFTRHEDEAGFALNIPQGWERRTGTLEGQVQFVSGDLVLTVVPGRDDMGEFGDDPSEYQMEQEPELAEFRSAIWQSSGGLREGTQGNVAFAQGIFGWKSGGVQWVARNYAALIEGEYHVVLLRGREEQRDEINEIYETIASSYTITD